MYVIKTWGGVEGAGNVGRGGGGWKRGEGQRGLEMWGGAKGAGNVGRGEGGWKRGEGRRGLETWGGAEGPGNKTSTTVHTCGSCHTGTVVFF